MLTGLLKKVFGSRNERLLKQYRRTVDAINAIESSLTGLSDADLQARTPALKARFAAGETLDDLLPEAFAVVREGSKRALGMRHFDVQLLGGIALHEGKIAEMRTGEGKTLTATLPVYLNALTGNGVHLITVNDYLAQRDAEWMGRLYGFLGLTVGINLSQMPHDDKQRAYAADITYGTNNEFGFDYLRDNMVYETGERVQRGLAYAIVDEVDSILIDEARTPLIISGQAEDHTELYMRLNTVPPLLDRMKEEAKPNEPEPEGDFWVDEKGHQIQLSEAGHEKAEQILENMGLLPEGASLYDPANILLVHHLMAALRAHNLFFKDQQYVVQPTDTGGEVVIVDEFTGRLMVGPPLVRRPASGGRGEGEREDPEREPDARVDHVPELLPDVRQARRHDRHGRYRGVRVPGDLQPRDGGAAAEQAVGPHRQARPGLQDRGREVQRDHHGHRGLPEARAAGAGRHHVDRELRAAVGVAEEEEVSARGAEREAARARGRDHRAGRCARRRHDRDQHGRPRDRHRARRQRREADRLPAGRRREERRREGERASNDCAARGRACTTRSPRPAACTSSAPSATSRVAWTTSCAGRSGRQGDPGSSRFYLSLDDPLLRIFAGDRVRAIMDRLKMPEGEPIEAGIVMRSIETAQRKVEARNFDIRKQLLEYDDVANDQRKVIYQQRNELLEARDISETIASLRHGVFTRVVRDAVPEGAIEEQWDVPGLERTLASEWQLEVPLTAMLESETSITDEDILERVIAAADASYAAKIAIAGQEAFGGFERSIMLQRIDLHWREHLAALDHLRQGIHLRGYAQKNPKQEYKREAFELFSALLDAIGNEVTRFIMTVHVQTQEQIVAAEEQMAAAAPALENVRYQHADFDEALATVGDEEEVAVATAEPTGRLQRRAEPAPVQQVQRFTEKVGRNDPCPCGSGKKYKNCHGKLA